MCRHKWTAAMAILVFFDRSAEVVGVTPDLARLILLKILVELIIRSRQHFFIRRIFIDCILLDARAGHQSL